MQLSRLVASALVPLLAAPFCDSCARVVVPQPARRIVLPAGSQESFKEFEARDTAVPADARQMRDIEFTRTPQGPVKLDVYIPGDAREPRPLIVWIHGGGWHAGSNSRFPFPARQIARGYVMASITHRDSNDAPFPAQIHDVKAAIRFLRAHAKEYSIDPKRIGVWGISAGGHLSALLGTSGGVKELEGDGGNARQSSAVQAVCDVCGPTDFFRFVAPVEIWRPGVEEIKTALFGGPVGEKRELAVLANPITHVDSYDPPFLMMHGDVDAIVPYEQSELLFDALLKKGVEVTLCKVEGGNHGGGLWGTEYNRVIDVFFDRHLKNEFAR